MMLSPAAIAMLEAIGAPAFLKPGYKYFLTCSHVLIVMSLSTLLPPSHASTMGTDLLSGFHPHTSPISGRFDSLS